MTFEAVFGTDTTVTCRFEGSKCSVPRSIDGAEDLRDLAFRERRTRLEAWHQTHAPPLTDVSELIPFTSREDLDALWTGARQEGIEGLMLKRWTSPYLSGRPRGHWFKWKRAALTLDCVLMYAQRGSGKRSITGEWASTRQKLSAPEGAPPRFKGEIDL